MHVCQSIFVSIGAQRFEKAIIILLNYFLQQNMEGYFQVPLCFFSSHYIKSHSHMQTHRSVCSSIYTIPLCILTYIYANEEQVQLSVLVECCIFEVNESSTYIRAGVKIT